MALDITDYLTKLTTLKKQLVQNLVTMGVGADETEGFSALIPKVLLVNPDTSINTIGNVTPYGSFGNVVHALTSGTSAHGEFSVQSGIPATGFVLNTGLEKVHGFVYWLSGTEPLSATGFSGFGVGIYDDEGNQVMAGCLNSAYGSTGNSAPFIRMSSCTVEDGLITIIPQYGGHSTLTPFAPGYTYEWVAW